MTLKFISNYGNIPMVRISKLNPKNTMKTPAILALSIFLMAATTNAVQVTFQVNMSAQTALGNFSPSSDSVFVAGDPINGWSTTASELTKSAANPNIWVGTFDVTGN